MGTTPTRTVLSNFHVLAWLAGEQHLPLAAAPDQLAGLLEAVRKDMGTDSAASSSDDRPSHVDQWAATSEAWSTTTLMASALSDGGMC